MKSLRLFVFPIDIGRLDYSGPFWWEQCCKGARGGLPISQFLDSTVGWLDTDKQTDWLTINFRTVTVSWQIESFCRHFIQ